MSLVGKGLTTPAVFSSSLTTMQESELIVKLESRLGETDDSTTTTPFGSPPGSVPEGSSSRDMFDLSQSQTGVGAMVLLDSGAVASPGGGEVIDVEGWGEEGGEGVERWGEGVDVLLQDLQHSSSSSESESESEGEEKEELEEVGEEEEEEEEEEEDEEEEEMGGL